MCLFISFLTYVFVCVAVGTLQHSLWATFRSNFFPSSMCAPRYQTQVVRCSSSTFYTLTRLTTHFEHSFRVCVKAGEGHVPA